MRTLRSLWESSSGGLQALRLSKFFAVFCCKAPTVRQASLASSCPERWQCLQGWASSCLPPNRDALSPPPFKIYWNLSSFIVQYYISYALPWTGKANTCPWRMYSSFYGFSSLLADRGRWSSAAVSDMQHSSADLSPPQAIFYCPCYWGCQISKLNPRAVHASCDFS